MDTRAPSCWIFLPLAGLLEGRGLGPAPDRSATLFDRLLGAACLLPEGLCLRVFAPALRAVAMA
jgi:hypothetical protein